ncbi:MAG: hypothetical protein IPL84_10420 [Chitinophagaceae bacterium]|nr:hypothetical protein [Chitinophagaceae bacterium]
MGATNSVLTVSIRYLTYQEIDKQKWDTCINNAPNGLIYAYSIYLDTMAKNWDALVLPAGPDSGDDYEAVMPLTWNRKYGVYYLYQPPFTACLGVFGRSLTEGILTAFLQAVPPKFKYWDIYFNAGNFFTLPGFNLYERMNYVLNLTYIYEVLYKAYRENIRRNIKKSEQLGLSVQKNVSITEVVKLAKEQVGKFSPADDDFVRFKKLYGLLYKEKKAITYAVYTKEKELMASAVFFFSHNRAYYILVGNHPNGKTLGASHALINAFIKDHSGEDLLLDFEGSDINSLAFFYSSFGATEEKYSAIKLNKLPALAKWFKN